MAKSKYQEQTRNSYEQKLKHALGWIGSFFLDSLAVALIGEVLKLFANPLAPSIGGIIGLLAIIATSILTFYLLMTLIRKTPSIEPVFSHITIHYDGNTPEFVTNNKTQNAYWVSDFLAPYIKKHAIPEHQHKKNKIETYCQDQKSPLTEETLCHQN